MYAFIVKSLWESYDGVGNFLSVVGTPCIMATNNGLLKFNGIDGFFVEIGEGSAVKFDASLANPINGIMGLIETLKV